MSYKFTDGIKHFAQTAEKNRRQIFEASVAELRDSIRFGSAVTGAPPMPVAAPNWKNAGSLRDSVVDSYSDPDHAVIYTTKWWAPLLEDDAQGYTFTSGGPGGWKLTAAAFARVVEANAKRLGGGK